MVSLLVASNAPVNVTDVQDKTALHWSAERGHATVAEVSPPRLEAPPEELTGGARRRSLRPTPTSTPWTCSDGRRLSWCAASPRPQDRAVTTVVQAAGNAHVPLVRLLLDKKANIYAKDAEGRTALVAAGARRQVQHVLEEALAQAGPPPPDASHTPEPAVGKMQAALQVRPPCRDGAASAEASSRALYSQSTVAKVASIFGGDNDDKRASEVLALVTRNGLTDIAAALAAPHACRRGADARRAARPPAPAGPAGRGRDDAHALAARPAQGGGRCAARPAARVCSRASQAPSAAPVAARAPGAAPVRAGPPPGGRGGPRPPSLPPPPSLVEKFKGKTVTVSASSSHSSLPQQEGTHRTPSKQSSEQATPVPSAAGTSTTPRPASTVSAPSATTPAAATAPVASLQFEEHEEFPQDLAAQMQSHHARRITEMVDDREAREKKDGKDAKDKRDKDSKAQPWEAQGAASSASLYPPQPAVEVGLCARRSSQSPHARTRRHRPPCSCACG